MDAASARRQAESLEALRRLEDVLGDVNRETVRLEGISRQILEIVSRSNDEIKALRADVNALRESLPWPGERGGR